ncbi:mandelate racemase/muconate lactonizing enzyme family protein [Pseudoalteromonas sp. FUC4]|uniref:mandelate racemase/muconate lactonizing enzyme family protein n=1 Tax=Pseudoalteromonas sp. FUC4 TaxID=2511201 RepID=UPI0011F1FED6|nr:mandelate racemase/muconate lactonizing enzyme family protein [Pseudoalteromonas sp. FUC4]KAA1155397.1 mandelate racemase/muconate lactonizing enzyme family protein [Pseudoalteromonas sp. FUC4]
MKVSSQTIKSIKVEYYQIPLAEVLSDAKHGDHTHFEVIALHIMTHDGYEGMGYTYTGGKGGRAIYSLLNDEIKPGLIGQNSMSIMAIWDKLQWDLHYVGRGGLLSFAISAVDIALWDIKCKRLNAPLWQVAGGSSDQTKCYAGGIDLNFSKEKLLSNIDGYLNRGFNAVKIKVGKPNFKEDIERVAAVRDLIGKDKTLMVDANYSMTVEQAIRFAKSIEKYDITWFEEPTIPDDYKGFARIAQATSIPLAMGENLHTLHEFGYAIEQAKLGFLQPDASNIGGITGWLHVASMAYTHNLPICSHGMHELHVSLLASQPHAGFLEVHSFPIDEYTTRPLRLKNGQACVPDIIGTGVEFDPQLVKQHLIKQS